MSQIPSSSTSSTNFEAIFTAALEAYKKQTKNDITAHPLAAQLKSRDSPGAVLDILQAQIQAFDKSQSGNKRLTNWLDPTVNFLFAFSTTLGNTVGLAVKDVRASQDALIDLFGRMDNFFKRLEKHIEVRPTAAMTDVIVKIMVELDPWDRDEGDRSGNYEVDLFAEKYLKKLVGRKDVEDALQRLDKLTQVEAQVAAAETLAIDRGIGAKVEDVDGRVQVVDERVQSVDTKVEGIDDKVQGVDSRVQGIDSNVHGVDYKIGFVIQGVKETGLTIQQVIDQVSDLDRS
ncbi:hypothetical protein H4582DRAFT_2086405 [Lactarius indigo]|nr:hypothetical protein H4582DRAFT_2086405 [Lactarius indigo]